jgi:hypothetical protein
MHAVVVAFGGSLVYLSFLSRKRIASLPSPGDVIIEEQKSEEVRKHTSFFSLHLATRTNR